MNVLCQPILRNNRGFNRLFQSRVPVLMLWKTAAAAVCF
jgi:hypothetical protein